ncbi:hypothetical protein CEXT_290951 [Caerostris extrusa]|uniref:Uncharacterized protein n=1 Tax=Caerostris extrusa TaxID=172846 RepID=A0AAV4W3N6_CAEEX|nr:hypothetical protein CEXT_290951 [Caerostris extrusa]
MDITDQNNYTRQSTSTETEEQRCQRQKRFSKFYSEAIRKTLKFCAATPHEKQETAKEADFAENLNDTQKVRSYLRMGIC